MVSAGNGYLSVLPINNNRTIIDALKIDVNTFQYLGDINGDL